MPSLNGNYSDGDYVAFWQRVKDFPEDSVYSGFEKTAKERMHDSVVLHVSQSAVNVFKKNSRGEEADSLEVFGEGSYDYFGLITTKNSPLGVILRHGSSIMSERGVFSYLKKVNFFSNLTFVNPGGGYIGFMDFTMVYEV